MVRTGTYGSCLDGLMKNKTIIDVGLITGGLASLFSTFLQYSGSLLSMGWQSWAITTVIISIATSALIYSPDKEVSYG